MTSLLARLGQLETRKAVQTIWSDGKRKRGDWICAGCRARTALRPRRCYSDDSSGRPAPNRRVGTEGQSDGAGNGSAETVISNNTETRGFVPIASREGDSEHEAEKQVRPFGIEYAPQVTISQRKLLRKNTEEAGFCNPQRPSVDHASHSAEQQHSTLWEHIERADEIDAAADAEQDNDVNEELAKLSTSEDKLLNLNYKQDFHKALAKKEADFLLRCLFSALRADDLDFIREIPQSTFTAVIRVLEPSRFVSRLGNAHIELSAALVENMAIAPMREVAYDYSIVLRRVMKMRRSAGCKLTVEDYVMLMRAARDLGAAKMNLVIWNDLHEDGHVPDVRLWNYYMASYVWKGEHNAGGRHKVRVIPFNMMARNKRLRRKISPLRFTYGVGPGGIRDMTLRLFNQMLANGVLANEESFRILITACARDGDVEMVKSVLRKVWRIDVAGIMSGRDEDDMLPRTFAASSSLRPTAQLLFTLAHCFGINNDIPTALRVVDFVARHYQLPITMETWTQLFEWTFCLSIKRIEIEEGEHQGDNLGQLPTRSPQTLWETMTGSPYFVQPTLGMYNQLIKNKSRHRLVEHVLEKMIEAFKMVHEQYKEVQQASIHLQELLAKEKAGKDLHHESIEHARQEWDYRQLIKTRNVFWARRWIRILLGTFHHGHRNDHFLDHSTELLTAALWDYRYWCPRVVSYETPTGFVEFELRQEEEQKWRRLRRQAHKDASRSLVGITRRYVGNDWVYDSDERHVRIAQRQEERFARKEMQKRQRMENMAAQEGHGRSYMTQLQS